MKKKIVLGVTGASGSIYAKVMADRLLQIKEQIDEVGLVLSSNARQVWEYELGDQSYQNYPFSLYEANNFFAPFASGSAKYEHMFVCPCSMGTMSRIACGISNDLITRAADVILKERRQLILMIRDTPYNLIQIENMQKLTLAGAVICPLSPSFYSKPSSFEALAATVVDRALDMAGFDLKTYRWGES